jgi:hypothetical protein
VGEWQHAAHQVRPDSAGDSIDLEYGANRISFTGRVDPAD